ncbi:hypothetical protein LPB140_09530 [Sphingorhabdus lutea]|uniref:Uncharacterized protein n=1 Tax=Sphingorhabdus lutea TaxID=1913578 RepID=A0A1L3JF43_9SPHN|nr:hypothetical protein LPB140_09530 [Sphingorhabdus lutea]
MLLSLTIPLLASCRGDGDIDVSSGVGITASRTGCPAVAIPDGTGDITIFDPVTSQDASAIDVVAVVTNVRSACNSEGEKIYTEANFEVQARRSDNRGARTISLPYFSTVVQGGSAVVAKRIGTVDISFADGEYRASAPAKAASYLDPVAARLPEDIVDKITRKRRAGDADAAVDPMSDPAVKSAILRSSFELLIGFQLTEEQFKYNATR